MKISTRGRYGVRAVFDLAYNGTGEPEQIDNIAERQGIPPRYLEQIFHRLKWAGIIRTKRGAKGGYYLGKRPSEITVADVVQVTDGPLTPVVCEERGPKGKKIHCHRAPDCVMAPVWDEAGKRLVDYLSSVTIEDLCRRVPGADNGAEAG
jgi:Rrf2 family protein